MGAYVRFCASQLTAAGLLQKLVELKPGFDEYLRKCQSHQRVKGMPLSFFLLKPVKRVMDYPILVEKILKNTVQSHPDHAYLAKALSLAKELCEQVNEGTRHKENTERLEWLQIHVDSAKNPELTMDEKLTFNSTTNLVGPRKFLHHGLLKKAKSSKEIVTFLFNDFLLLTYPNRSIAPQFSFDRHHDLKLRLYKKPIFLDKITILETTSSERRISVLSSISSSTSLAADEANTTEFGLELLLGGNATSENCNNNQSIYFEAQNIHDRKLWLQKLRGAIAKYREQVEAQKSTKDAAGKYGPRYNPKRVNINRYYWLERSDQLLYSGQILLYLVLDMYT
jgi:hypothetical protein